MRESVRYDRAVGFFSIRMLSLAAEGVAALIHRNGSMRLIIGDALSEEESLAIKNGYSLRDDAHYLKSLGEKLNSTLDTISDDLVFNRLETLSWLIAADRLDIKLALRRVGMFHDKMGVLYDEDGDSIVFHGSANETPYALLPEYNFESIDVFSNWSKEQNLYYTPHRSKFERMWKNAWPNTYLIDFPDVTINKILNIRRENKPPDINLEIAIYKKYLNSRYDNPAESNLPAIPEELEGRPFSIFLHQKKALQCWDAADFNGVLEHATGAGKTLTAVYGATKLLHTTGRMFLVIAAPYQNLADQWGDVARVFGWHTIPCYRSSDIWKEELENTIIRFTRRVVNFACCIVVNKTMRSSAFMDLIKEIPEKELMFVGDECHHLGSENLNKSLPQNARYRLGLSATPDHSYNPSSTSRITEYFGPKVHEYSLRDAIDEGVLTPYEYEIVHCELVDDEIEECLEISKDIRRRYASDERDMVPTDSLTMSLLSKRARIFAHAQQKMEKLRLKLDHISPEPLTLFYCGDGSVEGDEMEPSLRHVESVSRVLSEFDWRTSIFTAEESLEERRQILNHFRSQIIHGISAIRCLDEGIDVPSCRTAFFLASSRNRRQFIQRRGRILRRAPGKETAKIVDFVVFLPRGSSSTYDIEQGIARAELERICEFARLATNVGDIYSQIKDLLDYYDLADEFVDGLISS